MVYIYIISELLQDEEKYFEAYNDIYTILKNGFEDVKIRHKKVKFKLYEEDTSIQTLTRPRFIFNLIMFLPIMRLGLIDDMRLDETYILDFTKLSNRTMADFINSKIINKYLKHVDITDLNEAISEWREKIKISREFTILMASGMDIKYDVDLMNRNKKYEKLITSKITTNMQPKEVERAISKNTEELLSILKSEKTHPLNPMLMCKEGIKTKQLAEYQLNGGNKPDLYGNIIPIPLNTNYLYHGLDSIANFIVDSKSGRKAIVMNEKYIGISGYLARKINLVCHDTLLSDLEDSNCDTIRENYINIKIKNQEYLNRLNGRYFYDESIDDLRAIRPLEDSHLIGKSIQMKSPITCNDETVCFKCFGELAHLNKKYHVGLRCATRISMPISQNVLSAKHLLTADSEIIKFNKEFDMFLVLDGNMIVIHPDLDNKRLKDLSLIIYPEDIVVEESDDDMYCNYLTNFSIYDKKHDVEYVIEEENQSPLFITPYIEEKLKRNKNKITLPFIKINKESENALSSEYTPLFNIEIRNNELTKPLHDLKALLDLASKYRYDTIDGMVEKGYELLIEAKINAQFVDLEIIIRNLIRLTDNILERPNFNQHVDEYTMLTVTQALTKNPSLLISLSFQDIKRQLINPLSYKKEKGSLIDIYYHTIPNLEN